MKPTEAEQATSQRIEGPTPQGGAYAIAYFTDGDGRPCPKARAAHAEIIEYDEAGDGIFRTYGDLSS